MPIRQKFAAVLILPVALTIPASFSSAIKWSFHRSILSWGNPSVRRYALKDSDSERSRCW
jgi:hypothetical protein